MDILDALGIKAVGLRRGVPVANFFTWLFGAPRCGTKPILPIIGMCLFVFLSYGSYARVAPVVYLESKLLEAITPVVAISHHVINAVEGTHKYFQNQSLLIKENAELKLQNENVLRDNIAFRHQAFLDNDMRKNLGFIATGDKFILQGAVSATVLNTPGRGIPLLVSHSDEIEVQEDSVAIGTHGIVGRLQTSGRSCSKVVTILDSTFSVPVQVHGVQAIAKGQGSSVMILSHIQEGEHLIQIGDPVHTSGFGGIYKKALPVGYVSAIENKVIYVTPYESLANIHTLILIPPVRTDLG